MRNFVVIVALSSILLLANCGRLKINRDEPEMIDSKPVVITKNSISDIVTSEPMFTRKPVQSKHIVTSKPMFTVKKQPNRKKFEWFKEYTDGLPEGYHAKLKQPIIKPPQDDTVVISAQGDWDEYETGYRQPEEEKIYEPVEYPDLTVYPVDGDDNPYHDYEPETVTSADAGKFEYVYNVADIQGDVAEELFFAHGSAKINQEALNRLYDLSADIAELDGGVHVSVVGHASKRVDNVNDPNLKRKINIRMSEMRAEAVSKQLSKMGISSRMLIVDAKGASEPNPDPGNMPQEAADRRVDIYLY